MQPRIVNLRSTGSRRILEAFLERPVFDARAELTAARVLADIRRRKNAAILHWTRIYQGTRLSAATLRVPAAELARAAQRTTAAERQAVRETYKRVTAFAQASRRADWSMKTPRGGCMGERFVALERVGVYVPGGAAPLASTVLMTVTLARVAGVREIVVCTPAGKDGTINAVLLHALKVAGATEVYRVGGIQAIGLMAYGTETVRKVQKIVGPGGTYVTAAKKLVYGAVALDLVAGPSEIAVMADASANPVHAAADLLSQAEHGTGWEKALLVTPSADLACAVAGEVLRQSRTLGRRKVVEAVMRRGMLLAVVRNLSEAVDVCNRFAPEHLELLVKAPRAWLPRIRCAGAVFLGPWTPESAGDFVAGPSHVLPTGGAAAMFSGLMTEDFRRRLSFVEFTRGDLKDTLPVIETFGRVEGLDAHARSARCRFGKS